MTTANKANNATQNRATSTKGQGKQGFASMDKETVRKIAAKGGRASHSGQNSKNSDKKTADRNSANDQESGKQNFANMPKEQVQELARKGGESSHNAKSK